MEIERPQSRQPLPAHARKVFDGDIFDVYQWDQKQFDGSTKVFEKIKRDDTVVIIPSLSDKKLLLIEDEQPGRAPILTFPAGRMDKEGESPLDTAKRELLEETGYASEDWILWKAYQPVTKIDWAVYVFIAKSCKKIGELTLDAGEKITVDIKTLDEVFDLLDDPRFVGDEMKTELIKAKYDVQARNLLENRFFG